MDIKYGFVNITIHQLKEINKINFHDPVQDMSIEKFQIQLNEYFIKYKLESKKILIVIADKTRLSEYSTYLPVLASFFYNKKVNDIKFIIAYGCHFQQSDEESRNAYGDIYSEKKFIHPSQNEFDKYIEVGTTSYGTTVKVRKEIFEHDIIITFGAISHHYFAGYGGGRKLLFPGLASKMSIYQNHSLFLDKEKKCLNKYCKPGILDKNPIAEDLKEIDKILPPKISIHTVLNSEGKVCDIVISGEYIEFEKLCIRYDKYFKINSADQYDLVIASCGGFPKDINFIQSHKSLHNAATFVKNNGHLIFFAECRDGIGSDTFLKYFETGYNKAFVKLVEKYEGNGGTSLAMMEKSVRINIHMVTELENNICRLIGVNKIDLNQVNEIINKNHKKIAIIPNSSMVIKK